MHWKTLAMAQTPVTSNIHQTLDILLNVTAQITFDLVTTAHNYGADTSDLFFSQVLDPPAGIHSGGV